MSFGTNMVMIMFYLAAIVGDPDTNRDLGRTLKGQKHSQTGIRFNEPSLKAAIKDSLDTLPPPIVEKLIGCLIELDDNGYDFEAGLDLKDLICGKDIDTPNGSINFSGIFEDVHLSPSGMIVELDDAVKDNKTNLDLVNERLNEEAGFTIQISAEARIKNSTELSDIPRRIYKVYRDRGMEAAIAEELRVELAINKFNKTINKYNGVERYTAISFGCAHPDMLLCTGELSIKGKSFPITPSNLFKFFMQDEKADLVTLVYQDETWKGNQDNYARKIKNAVFEMARIISQLAHDDIHQVIIGTHTTIEKPENLAPQLYAKVITYLVARKTKKANQIMGLQASLNSRGTLNKAIMSRVQDTIHAYKVLNQRTRGDYRPHVVRLDNNVVMEDTIILDDGIIVGKAFLYSAARTHILATINVGDDFAHYIAKYANDPMALNCSLKAAFGNDRATEMARSFYHRFKPGSRNYDPALVHQLTPFDLFYEVCFGEVFEHRPTNFTRYIIIKEEPLDHPPIEIAPLGGLSRTLTREPNSLEFTSPGVHGFIWKGSLNLGVSQSVDGITDMLYRTRYPFKFLSSQFMAQSSNVHLDLVKTYSEYSCLNGVTESKNRLQFRLGVTARKMFLREVIHFPENPPKRIPRGPSSITEIDVHGLGLGVQGRIEATTGPFTIGSQLNYIRYFSPNQREIDRLPPEKIALLPNGYLKGELYTKIKLLTISAHNPQQGLGVFMGIAIQYSKMLPKNSKEQNFTTRLYNLEYYDVRYHDIPFTRISLGFEKSQRSHDYFQIWIASTGYQNTTIGDPNFGLTKASFLPNFKDSHTWIGCTWSMALTATTTGRSFKVEPPYPLVFVPH